MKLVFAVLTVAAISFSFAAPANAWYCSARATTGQSGWGTAGWLGAARSTALRDTSCFADRPQPIGHRGAGSICAPSWSIVKR